MRRFDWRLGAVVGVAALLALVMLLWPASSSRSGAGGGAADPAGAGAPAAAGRRPPPRVSLDPSDPMSHPGVQLFLNNNQYPPGSGRLEAHMADLLEPNGRHEKPQPLVDDNGDPGPQAITYLFTGDRYFLIGGETFHARLQAWKAGDPAPVEVLGSEIIPEREVNPFAGKPRAEVPEKPSFEPPASMGPLAFRRDGLVMRADFQPGAVVPGHRGGITLSVTFRVDDRPQVQTASLRVSYTGDAEVPARFTGEFSDRVDGGSLVVECGIEVVHPGYFVIDANLFDARGEPVGFTRFKGKLDRGRKTFPLLFFGKIIRDAGAVAPFTVSHLRGFRYAELEVPAERQVPTYDGDHQTRAHDASAFSDSPWDSAEKQRMLEVLLAEIRAGRAPPPIATGGEPTTP